MSAKLQALRVFGRSTLSDFKQKLSIVSRFAKDDGANVAMIFGLLAVPLVVMMGGAVDFMRFNRHKTELLTAMDSAALAVAKTPDLSEADADVYVTNFINAMVDTSAGQLFTVDDFTVTKTANGFKVDSEAAMETAFLQLIGITSIPLEFSTEVEASTNHIELALALDNTGSMRSSGKIQALRDAAASLVDIMYTPYGAAQRVKIGLVPFVTTVNIKDTTTTGSYSSAWIDEIGVAPHNGENFDDVDPINFPKHHNALFNASGVAWKGCVEARAEPYDTDITPPGGAPETMYVQFFSPDMDRNMYDYRNNYIYEYRPRYWYDPPAPPAHITQRDPSRYYTSTVSNYDHYSSGYGPNRGCPRPVVDLTNDTNLLHTEIAAMQGWSGGGTNIAMGQFWAWNLLDPGVPFSSGNPMDDKDTVKAMVLLTDGENVVTNPGGSTNYSRNINGSDYTGYGFLLKDGIHDGLDRGVTTPANRGTNNRLAGIDNNAAAASVDTKVAEMCTKIKAEKIRLYTITFQLNAASQQYLRDLFEACASPDGDGGKLYFNSPDNNALQDIFEEIAQDLSKLRIVR